MDIAVRALIYVILFITCYFTNLMEVYHIQGCLKEQRTQGYWRTNLEKKYFGNKMGFEENWKYDKNSWIPCLIAHAFEWAFCSILPIAIYGYVRFGFGNLAFWWTFVGVFFGNVILHYVIDIFRTHYKKITWFVDQALHCGQVLIMVIIMGSF